MDLLVETGVLLLPGTVFGPEYGGYIRFGFGRRTMPEALGHFLHFCNTMLL